MLASTECDALQDFIGRHARLFVLTGAGCSTESGIPDYRNAEGDWKRGEPIQFRAFIEDSHTRQRYWARSLIGWRRFRLALPNGAHRALAHLQRAGRIERLVTQNVDRLHQAAGSEEVIDLHGRLDQVCCTSCDRLVAREALQLELFRRNPSWADLDARGAPDGDADLDGRDFASFEVPHCPACLERADAMLVVGSSLMLYSGYRFAHAAARAGKPIAAVNLGRTRADELLSLKVEQSCAAALAFVEHIGVTHGR